MDISLLYVIVIAVVFIGIVKAVLSSAGGRSDPELKYRKLDHLFSAAEKSFLSVLNLAVNEGQTVFGKVRVADVITPQKGSSRSRWQTAFNKISAKHFDYLICNSKTLEPLLAIELNDSTHLSRKVKDRDSFLKGACRSAGFPLLFVKAAARYQPEELRRQIMSSIDPADVESFILDKPPSEIPDLKTGTCPKCGKELVKKRAKRGKNKGASFLACSGFPDCRYLVPQKHQ